MKKKLCVTANAKKVNTKYFEALTEKIYRYEGEYNYRKKFR